jgi:hypothetical protein
LRLKSHCLQSSDDLLNIVRPNFKVADSKQNHISSFAFSTIAAFLEVAGSISTISTHLSSASISPRFTINVALDS